MENKILSKLSQYALSLLGGLGAAVEGTIEFFPLCFIIIFIDVFSAYCLSRRVHKKYPERSDGKFKSSYKYRVFYTFLILFLLLVCANYVDNLVMLSSDKTAIRYAMIAFIFYEGWSIVENWSSENDSKLARACQRIMVNKAERHFNTELKDIFEDGNESNRS